MELQGHTIRQVYSRGSRDIIRLDRAKLSADRWQEKLSGTFISILYAKPGNMIQSFRSLPMLMATWRIVTGEILGSCLMKTELILRNNQSVPAFCRWRDQL